MQKIVSISSRQNFISKRAFFLGALTKLDDLLPFADKASEALNAAKLGLGEGLEIGSTFGARFDDLKSLITKDPDGFISEFSKLDDAGKEAVRQVWNKDIQVVAGKLPQTPDEFAKTISNADTAAMVAGTGSRTLSYKDMAQTIVDGINKNPSGWIEKYKAMSPQRRAFAEKIWKSHPESKTFSSIEDFAKSKIKPTTAPAVSTAPATAVSEVAPEVAGGTRTVTPAGEVVSDAGGAVSRADEAAPAISRTDEALRGERAAEAVSDASGVERKFVSSTDSMDDVIRIIPTKVSKFADSEIKHLLKLVESPDDAAKLISAEKSGTFKTFMDKFNDTELEAVLKKAGETIRANPKAAAQALTEAAQSSAPAAKAINLRRAAKIAGAVAAGLTGIALISYLWSGDEEEEEKITQSVTAPPATSSDSSLPQAGIGEYERASAIMIDKGYLSAPQSTWTPDFDKAFREFIDAGTANNKALTRTNLVGGQTWPAVASGLGFPGDKNGALSAVSVLSRFVPSKRAPTAPPVTTPTTGEAGVAQPERGAGGRGTESSKVDVLADIISRLYNDRLVEGGGGIFSNDLRQTQRVVKALPNGASLAGYRQVAELLLSRNPALGDKLPKTRITDVLSKKNIKSNPAYEAVLETQQTIHKLYEDANPGIINPLREGRAIKNIQKYLGSSAGGNWKLEAKNRSENMSKKGISKRATEMEGYGLRKEALAPLAIAAIGIGVIAAGVWAYNYISDYGKIASVYPDLGKRTELDILARFKKELDNLWFNSDKGGVLAYDAYAYFLGFNYGYDENKLVEKLKEIGVDFGDESFEEMMNDDEDGSYYSVVHHLNKGREDRAKADKGVAAQGGPEAVVEGTKSDSSSPQGTMEYTQLVGAPGTIKIEEVNDGQKFIYTIKSPTEFSYVWLYSDGSERKSKDSVTTENFSSKWNQTAETINKLPVANDAMAKSGFSKDRFVKLAEARKAKIREEVLVGLTPAEKAVIRRNKMREI